MIGIRFTRSHTPRERVVRPWPAPIIRLPLHPRVHRGYRYRGAGTL